MFIGQTASVSRCNYLHQGQGLFPEVGRSKNAVKQRAEDGSGAENTFWQNQQKRLRWTQQLAAMGPASG